MSVPLHWTDDNLPLGMMFGAAYGKERLLFQLAGQLERAAPWADKQTARLGRGLMSALKPRLGGCHCGAVRFEVDSCRRHLTLRTAIVRSAPKVGTFM